jgi:hypothetical protein
MGLFSICVWMNCVLVLPLKSIELQSLLIQYKSNLSFVRPQLLHLQSRLRHLTTVGLCTSSRGTTAVHEIHEQLYSIEQLIVSAEHQERSTGDRSRLEPGRLDGRINRLHLTVVLRVYVSRLKETGQSRNILIKETPPS